VLRVDRVALGSAASAAGLQPGDVIAAIDGAPVDSEFLLAAMVLKAESQLTLSIARGAEPATDVIVQLRGTPTQLGLSWRDDDAEPGAVFITRVVPHSPAARAGLRVQDRIYALDGAEFAGSDDLLARIAERLQAEAESLDLDVETVGRLHAVHVDLRLPTADDGDASL
jgi:S1-C subfamily serine protease